MKLSAITNKQKIREAIELLYKNLSEYSDEEVNIDYSSPGGLIPIKVQISRNNKFWWTTKTEEDKNKYWNPVGFGYPTTASVESSDCEFNCSIIGYKKAAGLFAKDNKNNIFLLHRGKAGGNTPGTSIDNFCAFYKESERQQILVNGKTLEFFNVSDINSINLLDNIIKYSKAISNFKEELKAKTTSK